MKYLIIFLLFFNFLLGEYLLVDDTILGNGENGDIIIYDIEAQFREPLNSLNTNNTLQIPIYISSNSSKAIFMKIENITNLINNKGEEISTSLIYKSVNDGKEIPIIDGVEFVILNNNAQLESRDGKTIVGYIIAQIKNISDTHSYGDYKLTGDITTKLDNVSSAYATFNINANIELMAIASFEPIGDYEVGKKFLGAEVNFGNILENRLIKKELFIKNNSDNAIKIKFDTSNLKHTVYPNNIIKINYFYIPNNGNKIPIVKNSNFLIFNKKNNGKLKVGEIEFEINSITPSLMAGDYEANVNVIVSVE